jgi:hypothetical protein
MPFDNCPEQERAPDRACTGDFGKVSGTWRNFLKVIEKARESCKNANNLILDHFVDANKSIPVPQWWGKGH